MPEGWVLDAHQDGASGQMSVWIKEDGGKASLHLVPWSPVLHVSGSSGKLRMLSDRLEDAGVQASHGELSTSLEKRLISHESKNQTEVLAVEVSRTGMLSRVANLILSLGEWEDFQVFSVDPKPTQRFLFDMGVRPMSRVRVSNRGIEPLEGNEEEWEPPAISRASLSVDCRDAYGKRTPRGEIRFATLTDLGDGRSPGKLGSIRISMSPGREPESFIHELERAVGWMDPDVLLTRKGDVIDFPALLSMASSSGQALRLGRMRRNLVLRRKAITNWSYGRLVRSEAYHALEGRVHVDMGSSFIGKEGGIEGLMELSRASGIPMQDLSRLSPGSAISAIQIRQSMEDGVLVPWKKNRAEDLKDGREMILADRGGLYLDPIPGVHRNVFELDFTSLFPSIIATRNISPETMNCDCCDPANRSDLRSGRLPLDPGEARRAVESRQTSPIDMELNVPEIKAHSCTLRHGFLGRVVAPIISRRRQLKARSKEKGDSWDRRQNVLKWLLVTCFGYTGYRNARFGRIECHESICAWSRDILLESKRMAEEDGWECLHAIVDSIWLVDVKGRTESEQEESIETLMLKIEASSGIPIELEDIYDWIAFVPNRTTGVSSLTKYFAYGKKGWKVRGIELRQHSTCQWVRDIQEDILEELREGAPEDAVRRCISVFRSRIGELRTGQVPLSKLVVSRRVRRRAGEHRVLNLTASALLRGESIGQSNPPGRKVRFVVVDRSRSVPEDRVRMGSEVFSRSPSVIGQRGEVQYYEALALRAASSLLSPFGLSEEMLSRGGSVQTSLEDWASPVKSLSLG